MKIAIMGAGKMGTFLCDVLSFEHDVAIFDTDRKKLRFTFNAARFTSLDEIRDFEPELLINAVTVKYTISAFNSVMPYLPANCIISDIASVKTGLPEFYANCHHPYVSTHPMFGPTFATLDNLASENAIIISEGDYLGKVFFRDLYSRLHLNIFEYTFQHQDAPGTTFKRHLKIAHGLMSEDDYLLQEILFNPHTSAQLDKIKQRLSVLQDIINRKDATDMKQFLDGVRNNLK